MSLSEEPMPLPSWVMTAKTLFPFQSSLSVKENTAIGKVPHQQGPQMNMLS